MSELPVAHNLDVGCGTGYLTRFLAGTTAALDFSGAMLREAMSKDAADVYVRGDALALPFRDRSFDRVFSSHVYGRFELHERLAFLDEARRVAPSLVVIDTPFQGDRAAEGLQERELLDGTRYVIYKKYFKPDELLDEIGGGRVLLSTSWFLAVAVDW